MNTKYAAIIPLCGTCLLTEIFTNNTNTNTEQVLIKNFEKIFSALSLRVASTLNTQMPLARSKDESETKDLKSVKVAVHAEYKKMDPIKISIACFKSFISATKSEELEEYFKNENLWSKLGEDSTHIDACFILAKYVDILKKKKKIIFVFLKEDCVYTVLNTSSMS